MRISSFDIFDTCIVRKCGAPRNLFDVLSYKVFSKEVPNEQRLEFISCRQTADESSSLEHLYNTFNYTHPLLLSKDEIMQKEMECEREMMVPVTSILQEVSKCRDRGDHIIFISDMYLPTFFLKDALSEMGFFHNQDSIYVSGECGHKKEDGSLYELIKRTEHLDTNNWHHYGDNYYSDVQQPNQIGITAHLVSHKYLPYEEKWSCTSNNLLFHTGEIMAGIGRSIILSIEHNPHNAFATDITAPLTTSFAYRIMNDANRRGIKKLFFCSRDCYALYHVAKKLERLFPLLEVSYFHTSRKALYTSTKDNLIAYFIHIGIAQTENHIGIVDIRTTGRSLQYINCILSDYGYNTAFGYYLEMFCSDYLIPVHSYHCEINKLYCKLFEHHHPILEKFLSLSPEGETVGYKKNEPIIESRKEDEDFFVQDIDKLSITNLNILSKYTDHFIETQLYHHADEMFFYFVIPTIKNFFNTPEKEYLSSLRNLLIMKHDGSYMPYIEETPSGISYKIAQIAQTTTKKNIRRLMKLLMRIRHIKQLPKEEWWPKGTLVYNNND